MMKTIKKLTYILILIILATGAFAVDKQVVPGVVLSQLDSFNNKKQFINIVSVDLNNPDISVKVALADQNVKVAGKPYGKQSVSTIVDNNNALVGINGDYFIMEAFRDTLNLSIINGELVSEPGYGRSVFCINKDGKVYFDNPVWKGSVYFSSKDIDKTVLLSGINRNRNNGELILYTNKQGDSTLGKYKSFDIIMEPVNGDILHANSKIDYKVCEILPDSINTSIPLGKVVLSGTTGAYPMLYLLKVGDIITIDSSIESKDYTFDNVLYASGGGPILVRNKESYITGQAENFDNSIINGVNPRSAIGITEDNKLILVSVDGRQEHSMGMTLKELSDFMLLLGCVNAMNLDGGGSTALSIKGLVVNSPSGIKERNVANAILVYSNYKGNPITTIEDYNNKIYRGDNSYMLLSGQSDNVIWGTFGGVGYIDETGIYYTNKSDSKGRIGFVYDGIKYDYNIEVTNAPLKDVLADFVPYDTGSVVKCSLTLVDSNNRPMAFSPIFVNCENGVTERTRYMSDNDGKIVFDIVWNENDQARAITFYFDKFSKKVTF